MLFSSFISANCFTVIFQSTTRQEVVGAEISHKEPTTPHSFQQLENHEINYYCSKSYLLLNPFTEIHLLFCTSVVTFDFFS